MKNTSREFPISVTLAATLIFVFLTIYGLFVLTDVIVPFIFATLFAIGISPISNFLIKKRVPKVLAIVIALLSAVVFLALFFYLAFTQIKQLDELVPQLTEKVASLLRKGQNLLFSTFGIEQNDIVTEFQKSLSELIKNGSAIVTQTLSKTTGFLANLALLPLYSFFLLLYADFLKSFFYKLFEQSLDKSSIDMVLDKITNVIQEYISGLFLVILIVGILNTVSLLILGIEHAVFFGMLAGVLVLIPYIGVAIGSLLPILMALITKDSAWYAVGVAGSFAFIQFLEGNFITPFVVGSKVSVNPLVSIMALLLFGSLWGISGLVLALPLTAILKVVFDNIDKLKPWGYLIGDAKINNKVDSNQA